MSISSRRRGKAEVARRGDVRLVVRSGRAKGREKVQKPLALVFSVREG